MFFPFSVKQIIRIDTEGGISSGPYVLNHIAGYMEDYGMVMQQRTENELSYTKGEIWRTFDRKGALRNVVFRVEFPLNEMRITLESETILSFLIGLLVGAVLFIREPQLPLWMKCGAIFGVWIIGWFQKWFLLQLIKKDLRPILEKI